MHIHLIAACGTGMAALAGLLKAAGHRVTGSDRNIYPPMSTYLETLGVPLAEGFSPEHLSPTPDLVVIGNAVRKENPEASGVMEKGIPYTSLPGALHRFFLSGKITVCVAGTHGKTTTTALISWLMTDAGWDPSFLIGGIGRNFQSPVRLGRGRHFVIEGDEYDTAYFDKVPKFLRYHPSHAILANVEFDHADIYPDLEAVKDAFAQLISAMPGDGFLVAGLDCPRVRELVRAARCPVVGFATEGEADITLSRVVRGERGMEFDIREKGQGDFRCFAPLAGRHNLKNILAAYAMTRELGMSREEFRRGLASFKNVARRQDLRGSADGVLVIDDFAHHPTAVAATLEAMAGQWKGRRIVTLFEPRTNTSRRRIFQDLYADAFGASEAVIIAPVHREELIDETERLDTQRLAEDLRRRNIVAHATGSLEETLTTAVSLLRPGDVAVCLSNGEFDHMPEKLLAALKKREEAS